ncbi:MAG TPA: lipopolysaccharide assembly protein LapA domain-containing protein [Acidimicrobiia bacterium]|nr:lipopolysaccharide assembly protein LapA domain-containing protein [Acidimicrobiia bacterium]
MSDERLPEEIEPAPDGPTVRRESTGAPWGLAAFLISIVLLVIFVVQNVQDVALKFLAWEGEYPLSLIIIVVIAISVLLDEMLGSVLRRRRRNRREEKEELRRLRRKE